MGLHRLAPMIPERSLMQKSKFQRLKFGRLRRAQVEQELALAAGYNLYPILKRHHHE